MKNFFRIAANEKPSDADTNALLSDMAVLLEEKVYIQNLSMFIAIILIVVLDIVLFLKSKYCSSEEDQ